MHAQEMISTHPTPGGKGAGDALSRCIEACYDCAQTCAACADACLAEDMVKDLIQCIRLNLDCSDVCAATGALASRLTGANGSLVMRMVETCAEACRLCGDECAKHTGMKHCQICTEACRRCESACREAAGSMEPTLQ